MKKLAINQFSPEEISQREWLVTNGLGGFASSSISGQNTRRYHGLLVPSLKPPTQRLVAVSKVEEKIEQGGEWKEISTNQYPGVIHPSGYQYLESFERFPFPRMVFQLNPGQLSKTICMVQGSNTTVIEYENLGDQTLNLELTPLYAYRDYHSLQHQNDYFDFYYEQNPGKLKIYPHYGSEAIFCYFSQGTFQENRNWFYNFEYAREMDRGLDSQEDLYSLGQLSARLNPGEKMHLVFSMDEWGNELDPEALKAKERKRQAALVAEFPEDAFLRDLILTGDQFIVQRESTQSYSIIAGYPWFSDWGRDTMIALRGLSLSLNKAEQFRSIIQTFLDYADHGMLPNRFPDYEGEEIGYNTVDATLWLFVVLYEYSQVQGVDDFIQSNLDILEEILQFHIKGTRYQIHVTEEGFLFAGDAETQLTWMDARVGDYTVTPRNGCPVEINALWYNALKAYAYFCQQSKRKLPKELKDLTTRLKENFKSHFWNEKGYLNDVIIPGQKYDDSIRPNQIYVLSLPFALLDKKSELKVFKTVEKHLFTELGLRSLSPQHPDFRPFYQGSPWDRDTAYHQGTVWPFLIGDYWMAYLKLNKSSHGAREKVLLHFKTLKKHFYQESAIGGISEIFDGENPGPGKGTVHQAWSISVLIKLYMDYKLFELPKPELV